MELLQCPELYNNFVRPIITSY